jgi:hypothetical protein
LERRLEYTALRSLLAQYKICLQKKSVAHIFRFQLYSILQAEITSAQINNLLEATGNTEVEAFYPIIFSNFLNSPEKIAQLIASPVSGGGGGGTF